MTQKILITGGSGLLALNWALATRDEFNVNLVMHSRNVSLNKTTSLQFKLDSINEIELNFEKIQPDIVVHTTGLTNVEECESNPELAHHVNVEIAENIAKVCCKLNVKLIHISTDHLFSGHDKNVDEAYLIAPVNVYAKTKAEAEKRVSDCCSDSLIIRTNFYCCGTSYRTSFSDLIINKLTNNESLTLFQDVFYTPIYTGVLVQAVHELENLNVSGVFNVVSDERLSKYDFGLKVAKEFKLNESNIIKGDFKKRKNLITRPLDMSLSNKKISRILKRNLGCVDEHIVMLKKQYELGYAQELQNI